METPSEASTAHATKPKATPQKRPRTARGRTDGLPDRGKLSYFPEMLTDVARGAAYCAAIEARLDDFYDEHGRIPRVVDIGVGTGLLTYLVLRKVAEWLANGRVQKAELPKTIVQAVDVNTTHLEEAARNIHDCPELNPDVARRVAFLRVMKKKNGSYENYPSELEDFDMAVSELLGSFTTSENALGILEGYFNSGKMAETGYVVPSRTVQHVSVYTLSGLPAPARRALERALEQTTRAGRSLPTDKLGVPLHALEGLRLHAKLDMLVEDFGGHAPTRLLARARHSGQLHAAELKRAIDAAQADAGDDALCFLSLEWMAQLAPERGSRPAVWLENGLDGYRQLHHGGDELSAMARNGAWGVFGMHKTVANPVQGADYLWIRENATPIGTTIGLGVCTEPIDREDDVDYAYAVPMAFDGDFCTRLVDVSMAALTTAAGEVRRVVVWNDPTSGALPTLLRRRLGEARLEVDVTCYSTDPTSAEACAHFGITSFRVGRPTRRSGETNCVDKIPTLEGALLLAPADLLPNGTRRVAFENYVDGAAPTICIPPAPVALSATPEAYDVLPVPSMCSHGGASFGALRDFYLDDVHSARILPLHAYAPIALFLRADSASADAAGVRIRVLVHEAVLPKSSAVDAPLPTPPTATFAELQRLAATKQWTSLAARIHAVPGLSFRAFRVEQE